jgi:hypothetical protein
MSATAEDQTIAASEAAGVRQQLEALMADELLRTSKRSVAFLRYIVEETLLGRADDLKERTIGVNVFGKALTYDTNLDHVVRTAASELRKRLTLYYSQDEHRDELRILLLPGSYVPQFRSPRTSVPASPAPEIPHPSPTTEAIVPFDDHPLPESSATHDSPQRKRSAIGWLSHPAILWTLPLVLVAAAAFAVRQGHHQPTTQQQFWKPLVDSGGPVLVAVGDLPSGPPIPTADDGATPSPARTGPPAVPFADVVTIARVSAILSSFGKDFIVRQENDSSFADLRERPLVLIGAFNNEWSLQLTRNLRYTLSVDPARHLLYIRDRQHPDSRAWAWDTGPHPGERDRASSTTLHDYALITRIIDSETGHDVIVMGGLYAYGTQTAGEFVANSSMDALSPLALKDTTHKRLQIVLETTVTDGTPGPPHVVAYNLE